MRDERILFAPGDRVRTFISPNGFPSIAYLPHPDYGAAPGLWLGLEFSIQQARDIGRRLIEMAALVEQSRGPGHQEGK